MSVADGTRGQQATGGKYVAMGSSFAAGAGVGASKPGTPDRCARAVNNYASLLATRLGLTLDDQSCGGATTENVLSTWDELPAQIDAVDQDTRLVTVTIGGNDLNYMGSLFNASCDAEQGLLVQGQRMACKPVRAPTEGDYVKLAAALRQIAEAVRRRAPRARLIFVQYVTLVPDAPCGAAQLTGTNADLVRMIGQRLAEITADVSRKTGSLLLPADKLSLQHTPCDKNPWANGMPADQSLIGAPWHPNRAGHRAIAEALERMVRSID